MLRRIRDKVLNFRPQEKVTYEQWEEIRERYNIAKKFLDDKNPIYLLLKEELEGAESIILENRVQEVRQIHKITDTFKKIFITPRKVQEDELIGQIKLIRNLFKELEFWVERKEELEKREAEGKAVIERDEKK